MSAERRDTARALVERTGADADWGWFLHQAARHRVLPQIAWNVSRGRVGFTDKGQHIPNFWLYGCVLEGNRSRNAAQLTEYARVLRALTKSRRCCATSDTFKGGRPWKAPRSSPSAAGPGRSGS
ncbi:hypothetical protein [Nonomuraea sp. NPDC049400]|uniref:hypothetical protein n=1 Tax=Nonomuraea sp. NPDC049400 TaxID=3364352 RepID=UPI0037AC9966